MQLQPGQLINAPFLSAPAEVKKFEPRSGYYLLEVVLDDGHHTFKPLRITAEQLSQIQVLERDPVALTADAEDFFYLIEAHGIRLAYQLEASSGLPRISKGLIRISRATNRLSREQFR